MNELLTSSEQRRWSGSALVAVVFSTSSNGLKSPVLEKQTIICLYGIDVCMGVEYGETCTDTGTISCTETGQICSSNTCACDTANNYYYTGVKCVKQIQLGGQGCSSTVSDSCSDSNAVCYVGACKCKSDYYDDNGSNAGGLCRQKIQLGDQGCSSTVSDSCSDSNAVCSGGACICKSDYYDDNGSNAGGLCRQKIRLGGQGCSSTASDSCSDSNAVCSGGACICKSDYYDDNGPNAGGLCRQKVQLGGAGCSTNVADSCSDTFAQCDGVTCVCKSGYYDDNGETNGGSCKLKVQLGGAGCSTMVTDSCSDTFAQCNGGTCACKSGYYDDNGETNGGSCKLKVQLGGAGCSTMVTDSCSDTSAQCSGGTCACKSGYYDDNGETNGGSCKLKVQLGGAGCSTMVTDSCSDTSAQCNGGTCACKSGYYDDNSETNGGSCKLKIQLGGQGCSSTVSDSCSDSNAVCYVGACKCKSDYYDDNGSNAGGLCRQKIQLGGQGCSSTVSDSCSDSNAVCYVGACKCKSDYYDDNGSNAGGLCRQKIQLGDQGCSSTVSDSCSDSNAVCSGGACICKSDYYDDNGSNAGGLCRQKIRLGGQGCSSTASDSCSDSNAVCSGGACICKSDYYDDNGPNAGGLCRQKVQLGGAGCSTMVTDSCSDTFAQCNGGTCACKSGYYDDNGETNGGSCKLKVQLGGAGCSTMVTDSCSDTSAQCSGGTCACKSGYYDDNGETNGGSCKLKVQLGGAGCSTMVTDSCSDTSAQCNGGTCACKSGYYDDNSETNGGSCKLKVQLGGAGCSTMVTDSCSDTSAQCNGGTCACKSGYYDDNGETNGGSCKLKVQLGGAGCSTIVTDSCSDTFAQCDGVTCVCKSRYYDDNGETNSGSCKLKIKLGGQGCSSSVSDSCSDSNAECSSGACLCKSDYYDDNGSTVGGVCNKKLSLGENGCSTGVTDSCKDTVAVCNYHGGQCQCPLQYYDNNGNSNGGSCILKVQLGGTGCSTIVTDSCSDTFAQCNGRTCECKSGYYDDNGNTNGGSCKLKVELGYICPMQDACMSTKAECVGLSNGNENVCACKTSYYDSNSDRIMMGECLNRRTLGSPCSNAQSNYDQCVDANALCSLSQSSYCSCNVGFHQENSHCMANKALGYDCVGNISDECSDPNAECLGPVSKVCTCKTGYYRYTPSGGGTDNCQEVSQLRVSGITFTDIQTDRFIVSWTPPSGDKPNSINMYTLVWRPQDNSIAGGSRNVNLLTSSQIRDLTAGKTYIITVISKNTDTEPGETRSTYTTKTQAAKPAMPGTLMGKNLDATDSNIYIQWTESVGSVTLYRVKLLDGEEEVTSSTKQSNFITFYHSSLKNGYRYLVTIQARSEQYEGFSYLWSEKRYIDIKTTVQVADAPQNLQSDAVTSRNFTLTWDRPVNIYSAEILGYVIQINKGSVCLKEIIFRCTGCTDSIEISDLQDLCNSTVRAIEYKSKADLGKQVYVFTKLVPDTMYSMSVTAVNNQGRGQLSSLQQRTNEEVPQKPTNVLISEIGTKSFKVSWHINDPRPGQTNFTIDLTTDSPATSKGYTVVGFYKRHFLAEELEEYWNYSVTVTASTSVGSMSSLETQKYRTLPAAPGRVSKFTLIEAPGGTYTWMQVSWKAPLVLERNGIIKDYVLLYNAEGNSEITHTFPMNLDDDYEYSTVVTVIPDETYMFKVYATNTGDKKGEITEIIKIAPAGVPVNIEDTLEVDVISVQDNAMSRRNEIRLTVVKDFFEEATNGKIQATGVLACAKECDFTKVKTIPDFNTMANWKEASEQGYTLYRVTSQDWLHDLKTDPGLAVRKKREVTAIVFTLGSDDCTDISSGQFCNGPLQPNLKIKLVAVSCTSGGCLLSREYGPFLTAEVEEYKSDICNGTTQTIVVGVVLGLIIIVLAIYAGYITILYRRNCKGKSGSFDSKRTSAKGPVYENESFMVGVITDNAESVGRNSGTEYSSLDYRTRDDMTTYETLHAM